MSDILEVLFSSDVNENQMFCHATDYRTGTNLMSYKASGGSAQQRGFAMISNQYVIAANNTKPLLHVWPINTQEQITAVRFVLPGRANAMALSPDGLYLVAGIQETIYLWHLTTGRMLNTIAKHYQPINCIRFTDDGAFFVSAGQDGGVLVWNLTQVVAQGDDNQDPLYSFTDHGLPVKDVHIGAGGLRAYVFTVSLDRTCKVYDLSSGSLLLSVVFAEGLQSVVANALETSVYVGTTEGNIYEFKIDALPRTKEYHIDNEHTNKFSGHTAGTAVNCLVLSVDGTTLISGGQDSQICIWHIGSRQLLTALPQKGAVTNLHLRLTSASIFNLEHKQPHIFSGNLKRMIDPPDADEKYVIDVLIEPTDPPVEYQYFSRNAKTSFAAPRPAPTTKAPVSEDTASELEALRAEVAQLKAVNNQLYQTAAKYVLESKKTKKQ